MGDGGVLNASRACGKWDGNSASNGRPFTRPSLDLFIREHGKEMCFESPVRKTCRRLGGVAVHSSCAKDGPIVDLGSSRMEGKSRT